MQDLDLTGDIGPQCLYPPIAKKLTPAKPPSFDVEKQFWRAGYPHVAGVDEVGRGALAGPLVAAAVIFSSSRGRTPRGLVEHLLGVRDSKLIRPEERSRLLRTIESTALAIGVGMVSAVELDELGLAAANRIAMERAVARLAVPADALVIDACVLELTHPQVGLIDADSRCLSVAAASIVAKVTRDRLMIDFHTVDYRYGFDQHKGYGVASHIAALKLHGPGPLHRLSFGPVARTRVASG